MSLLQLFKDRFEYDPKLDMVAIEQQWDVAFYKVYRLYYNFPYKDGSTDLDKDFNEPIFQLIAHLSIMEFRDRTLSQNTLTSQGDGTVSFSSLMTNDNDYYNMFSTTIYGQRFIRITENGGCFGV